jgi:hypothetical protein
MAMQEDEKFTGKRIFVISVMAASLLIQDSCPAIMDRAAHAKIDGSPGLAASPKINQNPGKTSANLPGSLGYPVRAVWGLAVRASKAFGASLKQASRLASDPAVTMCYSL